MKPLFFIEARPCALRDIRPVISLNLNKSHTPKTKLNKPKDNQPTSINSGNITKKRVSEHPKRDVPLKKRETYAMKKDITPTVFEGKKKASPLAKSPGSYKEEDQPLVLYLYKIKKVGSQSWQNQ